MAIVKMGQTVLYRSIFGVVRDMLHDEAFDNHDQVIARYLKPDLLPESWPIDYENLKVDTWPWRKGGLGHEEVTLYRSTDSVCT